jgi:basic amino acid/polyamine antiporter, APA family
MRFTHKNEPRGFRVPFGPWVIPPIGAILCLLLMVTSSKQTGIRLAVWVAVGQVIYFVYGFWHSKLRFANQIESTVTANAVATGANDPVATNEPASEMVTFSDQKF